MKKISVRALFLFILLSLYGCGLLINAALSGDKIIPLGNDQFRVTYDGYGADKYWFESCQKACRGTSFDIVSQQQIVRPAGLPGWTGVIQCKGKEIYAFKDNRVEVYENLFAGVSGLSFKISGKNAQQWPYFIADKAEIAKYKALSKDDKKLYVQKFYKEKYQIDLIPEGQ